MQIVIWSETRKIDVLRDKNPLGIWKVVDDAAGFINTEADIYINLNEDAHGVDYSYISKPILINSVAFTLKEINAGKNIIRINGWNSFLENDTWEIAGHPNDLFDEFFKLIDKKIIVCPDEPGFISAGIIAMIINEAYYAENDKVSNQANIDTAMKLGTNYPYGPFEWASIIGKINVHQLLSKLSERDDRYLPAPGLLV